MAHGNWRRTGGCIVLTHARAHYDAYKNGLALKAVLEKMEQGA